eukprot:Skav215831  [mRNA]  locus=scaffold3168:80139:81702:- [translate_table: standard]
MVTIGSASQQHSTTRHRAVSLGGRDGSRKAKVLKSGNHEGLRSTHRHLGLGWHSNSGYQVAWLSHPDAGRTPRRSGLGCRGGAQSGQGGDCIS